MVLEAKKIGKTIRRRTILSDISLSLESGKIYGFVGRNGCGKTMLFRALSGLMRIDTGEVCWNQKVLHRDMEVLPDMGIVLENAGLYPEFSGMKNLQLLSKLRKKIGDEEIRDAIRRVGLDPDDKRTFRKYSLGMKQRLVIAQAVMEKPDVIFLDEPTNGLDEGGVDEIRTVITEEKERGALILLASHNKEDMELLTDKIYFMESGRIVEER